MNSHRPTSFFPAFDREFLNSAADLTVIGTGEMGGKAKGLAYIHQKLTPHFSPDKYPDVDVSIPRMTVLLTDVFEAFIKQNQLESLLQEELSDQRIAHAFQKAEFPARYLGDLNALANQMRQPLAVRSSSLLEDALAHPFAGTYATKMIPNNQSDASARFRKLIETIKYVYASTYFQEARSYMRLIGKDVRDERMALVIQEVVGAQHGDRFYPTLSGVIRSYNVYPTGPACPQDGVVMLALGLGKTIVDGGVCWTYSPAYPSHRPPFGSVSDTVKNTQSNFWAVNMGKMPAYDPINEAEYLSSCTLKEAEYDGTLKYLASTYDMQSDRLVMGTGRSGPRVLTFAPILEMDDIPLNALIQDLVQFSRERVDGEVEIEFAVTLHRERGLPMRFGFLQIRPILVAHERVQIEEAETRQAETILFSEQVLGNGVYDGIVDIVYVKPEVFEARHTQTIAGELDGFNRKLVEEGRRYVLLGFGRWGSSDPWLGIPVNWPQISGAQVIVEATLPEMNVDPSQGTHFFHNMTSFRVAYITVKHYSTSPIRWDWLSSCPMQGESQFVRHVRLSQPLTIKVDGQTQRAIIVHNEGAPGS